MAKKKFKRINEKLLKLNESIIDKKNNSRNVDKKINILKKA